jgi:hypothetical protein
MELIMKTTDSANYLNDYLVNRTVHPLTFESVEQMCTEINTVQDFMASKHPELRESPFITAVHVSNNTFAHTPGQPQVDDFRLFNTSLAYLSMTPIDEISPAALTVFAKIAEPDAIEKDKFRSVTLLAQTLIRADELDPEDRKRLKQSCSEAATALRAKGFFNQEFEQRISKSVSRDHGREFVNLLGVDVRNIPSLRHEVALMARKNTAEVAL